MRVGDPWDPETQLGPLSIRRQLDRVLGYIEKGKEAGARLVSWWYSRSQTREGFLR
jgi:aldehyde dehydrogenase (NAD+)